MSLFQCVRENEQKLWVQTPPVTHNVWGFFIKDIFPRFSIDKTKISISDSEVQYSMKRWDDPKHKYLVRERNEDGSYKSCIADGEGLRWTHADLPDDKRAGLQVHDWGLIYIPNPAQFRYLDFISSDLVGNPDARAELLLDLNQLERNTMRGLLLKLKGFLEEQPQSKTVEELRKKAMGLYGRFEWMVSYPTRETLGIGKLPLTSKNPMNTIEGQTELDFYRVLDRLLGPESFGNRPYVETGGIGWCMDKTYRHLSGEWIICPNLNEIEKHDPVARMLSDHGPLS
jgi:hypothetical protein